MLREIIAWADCHPWTELQYLYHVTNEGKRSPRQGAMAKAMGLRPGVPDLHLPIGRPGYIGLWIELKTEKGRVTPNQRRWLDQMEQWGHRVEVCRSVEEAQEVIEDYLGVYL